MRARIAGHPLHPALVHFPMALWLTAIVWDVVGTYRPEALWWQMGFWSLTLGVVSALPALVSGFIEYLALDPDEPAMNTATLHMLLMFGATVAFGASVLLRVQVGTSVAPSVWAWAITLSGAALLAGGGWLGGKLVYHHGIGRRRDADDLS
ncbi:MAG: DUF2231 domain-containing protein [Gammaproteobacteria bacterium]|nr:DUF2231 domain-containing protein [Gammaproteobacteria bacterium]